MNTRVLLMVSGRTLALVLVSVQSLVGGAAAAEPDWSVYERLLQRYVSRGAVAGIELNQVDYGGLGRDPEFAQVVASLSAFPLEQLASRGEKLAFYVNAYNILALKMVIDNWPLESIKDAGSLFKSVWKRPAGIIGGHSVTLDDIEHGHLRKMNEPRMHFAIVCASVSCPDLRQEPYRATRLDAQLDAQCAEFLNNPGKGLRVSGKLVEVSKIFKWFATDFETQDGVEAFVRRYFPLPDTVKITPSIDYNWALNGR